jgi:hypothetical protein
MLYEPLFKIPVKAFCLFCVFALCSCGRERREPSLREQTAPPPALSEIATALVRTGAGPFWFELVPDGPRLIPSPHHASLEPFIPWRLARHITAFLAGEDSLIAAVNQEGFLVFARTENGTAFYYHKNPAWNDYSIVSVFWYGNEKPRPAALLARDMVFAAAPPPPPRPAVWLLEEHGMAGMELPAFTALPASDWETGGLVWDGRLWYCRRLKNSENGQGKEAYLAAASLDGTASESSGAAFLEAARPRAASLAPFPLAEALEAAGVLAGKPCTFQAVSPEFSAVRIFQTGMRDDSTELVGGSAYYRTGTAIVLLPDGRGVFRNGDNAGTFTLPVLPEHYAYTAAGLTDAGAAGTENGRVPVTVIAAWEEQKDWNIGAAGFVMLELTL